MQTSPFNFQLKRAFIPATESGDMHRICDAYFAGIGMACLIQKEDRNTILTTRKQLDACLREGGDLMKT